MGVTFIKNILIYFIMSKEVRKITAGLIFSWIFGILFLFGGMGVIGQGSLFSGIVIMLCSAMIIPYFNKLAEEKFNFKISGGIKFILIIIIFIFMGIGISNSEDLNSSSDIQQIGNSNSIPKENGILLYSLNEEIIIGDFKYILHGVKSKTQVGESILGIEKADGIFLIADVTIENINNEPEYFQDNIFIVDSQGREFEEDIDAKMYYGYDNLFSSLDKLQPGLPKRAEIIFDVPKDTEGKVGIKKSMWSSDFSAHISW